MRSSRLCVKEEVGQRSVSQRTVKSVTNKKAISNEKIKQRQKMQALGTSFLAVKDYKEFTDMDDELYLYKVDENEQIIFKTSSFKMKLANTMNSENEEELPSEFCFFDGKVKRTKGFTLTASCYNPFLGKQVPLAVMECTKEDEENITRFWKEFNEAYKVPNKTNAKFQTIGWVTDVALNKFSGFRMIYGEEVLDKIKGCKFHYKQSVNRRVHLVGIT